MYNYQLVFKKCTTDDRIIITGTTNVDPKSLINYCFKLLVDDSDLIIENFSYIPKEFCENGKKEKTPQELV